MSHAGDTGRDPRPGTAPPQFSRRLDVTLGVLCALLAVAIASFALLSSRRFFYIDDYQTYLMPAVREIARLVRAGELPFITDRLWQGGALMPEYQAGVTNPVAIGLYLVMSFVHETAMAAALFSLFYIALFASGTYVLCRTLGCAPRHAFAAGLVATTADWIIYWGAANWVVALVSMGWMTWAAALLIRSYHDERWLVPAVVSVALFFTCGWPFGIVAWMLGAAVVFFAMVAQPGRFTNWKNIRPWLAMMAGGLIAAPAILPMFPYLAFSERELDPGRWSTNLASLSSVGLPFYATSWRGFGPRAEFVEMPMIYIGWFVPLVIANADWRELWRSQRERVLIILIAIFATLSMLPYLWHFRWMFRLLPYYNILLVVLMALILTRQRGDLIRWRYFPTALALSFPVVLSIAEFPTAWQLYLISGLLVLLLIAASLALKTSRTAWLAFALASQVAIVWYANASYVQGGYPRFPNGWSVPFQMESHDETRPLRRRLALFAPPPGDDPGSEFWRTFMPANTSLFADTISVNGYSPYHTRSYRENFCFAHLTATVCDDIADRLLKLITPTGRNLLDLMRIDQLVVEDPVIAEQLRAGSGGGWTSSVSASGITTLERDITGSPPPDPVSWQGDGVRSSLVSQTPQRVVLDVENTGAVPAMIVLARAWYPGWQATLGDTRLQVEALNGLMVSVMLPAGMSGRLTFVYWPENFWLGIWIAALGLAIMLAMLLKATVLNPQPAGLQDMQR